MPAKAKPAPSPRKPNPLGSSWTTSPPAREQEGPDKRHGPLDVCTFCQYNGRLRFGWDEGKRKANLRKHGLDFRDARRVFAGVTLTVLDDREEYGEDRYLTVGLLKDAVVVVAHTERPDVIRIISMRKATRYEETHYFAEVGDQLEAPPDDEG